MRFLIVPALALLLFTGNSWADTRHLQGFVGVGAEGQFHVDVAVADHFSVEVTGPDAAKIETRVEGNLLKIRGTSWHWFGEQRYNATVHVTLPHVEELDAARGAELSAAGVNSDHMAIHAAMGGAIRVSGVCQSLSAAAAMGGEIDANALDCASANVAAAMGGDARVHARETLTASAAMGGDIHVSGNPAQRTSHEAMGGDVNFN